MDWPQISKDIWKKKTAAFKAIDQNIKLNIKAYDIDSEAISIKENALEAGVDDCISFEVKDATKYQLKKLMVS